MTGKTHIAGGAAASAALILLDPQVCQNPVSGTLRIIATSALCLLGSVLPDIDLPTSLVGHSCKLLSVSINKLFGHRGFLHSLAFAALPLLLARFFAPHLMWAASALSIGILSHLALDLLNPAGEAILWPCVKRFHVAGIRMGSAFETAVRAMLIAGIFLFIGLGAVRSIPA